MTNGEKIKAIFPNAQIDEGMLEMYVWLDHEPAQFTKDWWNAEYKEPTAKNDLAVDAVSRKAVITIIQNHWWNCRDIDKLVNELPSVTPQEPRRGHWITNAPQYDMLNPQYICSECGNAHTRTTPYCEMCGARMVEPQESEEREE